jgi:hypothetical protein
VPLPGPLACAAVAAALVVAGCGAKGTARAGVPPAAAEAAAAQGATRDDVPSERRRLRRVDRITGDLTPKSVVASGDGLVVAQNMIYMHTVSAFSSDGELLATIDDAVTPSRHGYEDWKRKVRGGPVEAAFSPDKASLWVSNYSMYGPGFARAGDDDCSPDVDVDDSFLYRIDTEVCLWRFTWR